MTVDYYNKNADKFFEDTVSVDMSGHYTEFLKHIKPGGGILDLGCGSGRDVLYFSKLGFSVTGIDNSEELVKKASKHSQSSIYQMDMRDITYTNQFDGVWACSSLLHLKRGELVKTIGKIIDSLISGGVVYASFKYGSFYGERGGRWFTDMDEKAFSDIIAHDVAGCKIIRIWKTSDVRPGRSSEKWLNVIVKKM